MSTSGARRTSDRPETQSWELGVDGMETEYGLLAPVSCADRATQNAQAASAIGANYPDPPNEQRST